MSLTFPSYDTHHIIQRAMKSKTLGELGRIEDKANSKNEPELTYYTNHFPTYLKKEETSKLVKGKSADEILDFAGIKTKTLRDGSKSITQYYQPSIYYTYSDLGVDEKELIKGVTKVFGNLNLYNSSLENTGSINAVYGDITIGGKHSLKDLSSIKEVYGSAFIHSKTKEDAIKTLKGLNFNPERFTGKIFVL